MRMTTQEQPTQGQTTPTDAELSPAPERSDVAAQPTQSSGPDAGLPASSTAQGGSPNTDLDSVPRHEQPPAGDNGLGTDDSNPSVVASQTAVPRRETLEEQGASAVDTATAAAPAAVAAPATDQSLQSLFGDGDLSGLRTRWDDVQASFVDDPRECVHKADGLVSEVVEQLTAGFSQARSRLEEQWGRGEQASTEDLRIALKGYREFFQRLLAV
jgi:hypothetical protein